MHGSALRPRPISAPTSSNRTWGATFACALATTILFYLPDAYLYWSRGLGQSLTLLKLLPLMVLLGLFLTLVASRFWRILGIAFALIIQLIWVGMFSYAGIAPAPSAILLGQLQLYEVHQAVLTEPALLYSPAAVVALSGALILILQEVIAPFRVYRLPRWGLAGLLALDAGIALMAGSLYADPDPADTSLIGGFKMAVGGARILVEPRLTKQGNGPAVSYAITPLPTAEEPVTIAFIMGESVSADRFGLLGAPRATTPRLVARAKGKGPFRLFYKAGFSNGVSTIASVPNLISMLYTPNDIANARAGTANLFRLADASGFVRYLYTAQAPETLARATNFSGFARIETGDTVGGAVNARRDDVLIDLVRETPPGPRRFFFLQQRVNHFPYMENCFHVPEVFSFEVKSGSPEERRRATYDNGLLCADRAIDSLFEAFSKMPGAVYVFYMSDHGELMGTAGRWGHSFTDLRVAHVPMLLFTNRPDATIEQAFADERPLSAFEFASLTARALGHSVQVSADTRSTFYVNGTLPFGRGGFLEVKRTAAPNLFQVGFAGPTGEIERRENMQLPSLHRIVGFRPQ